MKKFISYLILGLMTIAVVIGVTACSAETVNELIGTYYCTTNPDDAPEETISIDVVNSAKDGIVSVKNVTLETYGIENFTDRNIKYVIESSSGDLYNFVAEINGKNVRGTIDIGKHSITIGSKIYEKS